MKTKTIAFAIPSFFLFLMIALMDTAAIAQVDTTQVVKQDSAIKEATQEKKKDDKRRKDAFIVYAGVNFSQLNISSSIYEPASKIGYQLGGAYKRGKFFYWQAGARFSNAVYGLQKIEGAVDSTDGLAVRSIDVSVTGGINFLSMVNRILALRVFVSAVPSFTLGVGSNDFGIKKDDLNSFIFYGQGGIGVDVAFLVIEAGYNYGFQDLFKAYKSAPGQVFINLGFRF